MTADDLKITNFDAAEYLEDEDRIAAYLNASAELNDPVALLNALSTVARARSMTELAQHAGLGRESLYKALKPGAQPRYETIMKVIGALGVEMVFRAPERGERKHASPQRTAAATRKRKAESPLVDVSAHQQKARKKSRTSEVNAAARGEPRSAQTSRRK